MFGYVRINKGELKVKEYEAYRGIYCSLCRALSKRYGVLSRLILSYDMTFFAMVRLSKDGVLPEFQPGRCPFNPTKRCNYCSNAAAQFDYVCAVSVLMFYYKLKDDLTDESFFRRLLVLLILPFASHWRKKALRQFAAVDRIICESVDMQTKTEAGKTDSFDRAAHASADALGKLFAFEAEEKQQAFYRFGYAVGRWVYLTDAADDIEKDIKRRRFNVFAVAFQLKSAQLTEEQKSRILETLNASEALALEAFRQTDCIYMSPIIANILNDGMNQTKERMLKGERIHARSI